MRGPIRIAFHTNQLGLRGTDVAVYDYAHYNEAVLLNESIILVPRVGNHEAAGVEKFQSRFRVFHYDTAEQRDAVLDREQCTALYCLKYGVRDGVVASRARTLVHCVFDMSQPHGDVYAGISPFLVRRFGGGHPVVPHMVSLPDVRDDLRAELGIPADAIVFGRHGGYETFDLDFARAVVDRVAGERPDIVFLFLNTQPFCDRPNVRFLEGTSDVQRKTRFINSCDAMLHARAEGETFGLACGEFAVRNKPVITCGRADYTCHLEILGDTGLVYDGADDLYRILTTFRPAPEREWDVYSARYNPLAVMHEFERVFLAPLGLAEPVTGDVVGVESRGRRYWLMRNDNVSRTILRGEDWEPHVTACMTRLLRPGDYVVDVGALFGFHTLTAAALVGRTGRVMAFEPQRPVFRLLRENCIANGAHNVRLYHAAVADQLGQLSLNPVDYGSDGVNLGDAHVSLDGGGELVPSVPLDELPLEQPVRFVKIDVQGAERFVLQGAVRRLMADRPVLVVEFEDHCLQRFGYSSGLLFELVRAMHYTVFFLDYRYPSDHLCVPNERVESFREAFAGTILPHRVSNSLNANVEHGVTEKVVLV